MPTGEALVFLGVILQAAAVLWVWRDWRMSQYLHADWKKAHRQSESETLTKIARIWANFGGPASCSPIDWDKLGSSDLENMSKEFPASGDDETLKKRKIDALTPRYGIGPSDAELLSLRGQIEYLALLRRGVADYRTFTRRNAFETALMLMLAGFTFQLVGSWPSRWFISLETPPAVTNEVK